MQPVPLRQVQRARRAEGLGEDPGDVAEDPRVVRGRGARRTVPASHAGTAGVRRAVLPVVGLRTQ